MTSEDTHGHLPKPKQQIIIGIDFGTTYSGVAWADSTKPREINLIRQWPNAKGKQDMDKVPSVMQYDSKRGFKWGYQISTDTLRQSDKALEYLKLLLDPSQEKDSILPDPLGITKIQKRIPFSNKPVDVVADYLKELREHALKLLSAQYGREFWKTIPTEYHLTIPAVWSESAKALTLEAAKQAGIGMSQKLVLIAEPEAAALYCLTEMGANFLKKGDTFMVADCGGGTVDLVSYTILNRSPKLEMKEVAVGGGLCGSIFLNRRFELFIRDRLGNQTIDKMIQKGKYWKMLDEFDGKLKHDFDGSDDQAMDCPVPGLRNNKSQRIEEGYMEINREEMEGIFDPVIDEILRLIQDQLDTVNKSDHKPISTIILVGGFGSSPYLHKQVENHIKTKNYPSEVTVLQPPNGWSAVARGAVICGLNTVDIESRQARRSYGVKYQTLFDPANPLHTDPGARRVWCPVRQKNACVNLMRWYVKKDDEVREKEKKSFPFFRTYWEWDLELPSTLIAEISLFGSESPRPEVESYSDHENVYTICTIKCDLNPLREHLEKETNASGEVFYKLNFSIVMYIHSAQLLFGVEHMGKPCGVHYTVNFF